MKMKISLALLCMTAIFSFISTKNHESLDAGKENRANKSSVSFKQTIQPIIENHCMPCHAENNLNPSELYFDTYESMMKGGISGRSIIPGEPEKSLLINKLSDNPPVGHKMPRRSKTPLQEKEIEQIKSWILQGAKNN